MQLPTLSTNGRTVDPILGANLLLSYFYIAEEAQTYFYTGDVKSIKYIIYDMVDIDDLKDKINKALIQLYTEYSYTSINILLNIVNDETDDNIFKLDISVSCDYKGTPIRVVNSALLNKDTGVISIDVFNELDKGR